MDVSMRINRTLFHAGSHKHSYGPLISCQLTMQCGKKPNFYQILGLNSHNIGFDEIKKAYKKLALQYHPDVCTEPLTKEESSQRFIELKKAYETLSDPNLRGIYDSELGLEDPCGSRSGETRREGDFAREVWEKQLDGLRKRSCENMKKKKGTYE